MSSFVRVELRRVVDVRLLVNDDDDGEAMTCVNDFCSNFAFICANLCFNDCCSSSELVVDDVESVIVVVD